MNAKTLPEILGEYAALDAARFHMPGHKGQGLGGYWCGELGKWDITELSFSDNLQSPESAIFKAQQNCAKVYGARASFFLVNGSTAAVHAMLLSLGKEEKLLLSRDCHKSAVTGVALAGIETSYILPEYDEKYGMWGMVSPQRLDEQLVRTGATAVLITSPNYYGLCADIPAISAVCHARGALLLVDSAHGAHFPFSDALPEALAGYADLWGHSQHKTMNALTQSATLHVGNCRVLPETVQRVLCMIQTTSPSYLLMSSLDWSIYSGGKQDWTKQARRCETFRKKLSALPGISTLADDVAGTGERDKTRLVIDVTARGLTGYAAAELLEQKNIFVEMADLSRLVCITSPEDDPAWYDRLYDAVRRLPYGEPMAVRQRSDFFAVPVRMSIRDAAFSSMELVPFATAAGRVAGEAIGVYPPGIALCMPGEEITREVVQTLSGERERGAHLFGIHGDNIAAVKEQ